MNSYKKIINFGPTIKSDVANPLTYCVNNTLDGQFIHGSNGYLYGQNSDKCQMFMSDYCALKWDGNCELASMNQNKSFPNNIQTCDTNYGVACLGLTAGDVLIQNTAMKKYMVDDFNCEWKYEPFDPTVANSPLVRYKDSTAGGCGCNDGNATCVSVYEVDPSKIDEDPVMNRILQKPLVAITVLINIYNTMKRKGTLDSLNGTKLGNFYKINKSYFEQR
jgi:hypothetical protein